MEVLERCREGEVGCGVYEVEEGEGEGEGGRGGGRESSSGGVGSCVS